MEEQQIIHDDLMYEIILNADGESLKNLCFSNKKLQTYCNDKTFWRNKFKNDKLPFYIIMKHTFKEYEKIYKTNNNIIIWINLYNDLIKSVHEVDRIMTFLKNVTSKVEWLPILNKYVTLTEELLITLYDNKFSLNEEKYFIPLKLIHLIENKIGD